jgi:hypothetical protein
MISLREDIDKVKFTDLITAGILGVAGKNSQITRECGRVAREINNLLRSDLDQTRERSRGHAGAGRVKHHQVRPLVPLLEKCLHSGLPQIRRSGTTRLKIALQIARSGFICLHGNEPFETIRERQAEKPYAGEKVEGDFPARVPDNGAHKLIENEAIHLEKREVADTIGVVANTILDVARTDELEVVRSAIMNQCGFNRRQSGAKSRSEVGRSTIRPIQI